MLAFGQIDVTVGLTLNELRVFTRNGSLPTTLPNVAVMVVTPRLTAVATPCDPLALLMVATPGAEEAHVTCVLKSCIVPSL
jgi:hypothetical protein